MHVIVVVMIMVVLAIAVVASPPYPCTYTDSKTLHTYDLSNMWRNASKGETDFVGTFDSDGSTFYVNVCDQTVTSKCSGMAPNGVCQVMAEGTAYGDGDASRAYWGESMRVHLSGISEYFVHITYEFGSGPTCYSNGTFRTSVLNIYCDDTVGDGVVDIIRQYGCTYNIIMRSKWACLPVLPAQPFPVWLIVIEVLGILSLLAIAIIGLVYIIRRQRSSG